MTDESDEEIGKRILARFSRAFELGRPSNEEPIDFKETRGRGKGYWHAEAIAYSKQREAAGMKRNVACDEFNQILKDRDNYFVTKGTVRDVVRSHYGRPYRGKSIKEFELAVLENDLDEAIKWFKHLSPIDRKKWRL